MPYVRRLLTWGLATWFILTKLEGNHYPSYLKSNWIKSKVSLKKTFTKLSESTNVYTTSYLVIIAQTTNTSLWGNEIPSLSCGSNPKIHISTNSHHVDSKTLHPTIMCTPWFVRIYNGRSSWNDNYNSRLWVFFKCLASFERWGLSMCLSYFSLQLADGSLGPLDLVS